MAKVARTSGAYLSIARELGQQLGRILTYLVVFYMNVGHIRPLGSY